MMTCLRPLASYSCRKSLTVENARTRTTMASTYSHSTTTTAPVAPLQPTSNTGGGSGFSTYSPLSSLERQSVTPNRRLHLFVCATTNCYIQGGVEKLLKSPRITTTSPQQVSNANGEALVERETSSAVIANNNYPGGASDDPFSFLSEDAAPTGDDPQLSERNLVDLQASRKGSGGGSGGGVGRFFQKVAKGATSTLERSMHNLAIKADQGRSRDLLIVGLYSSQGALLSMTESQPLPETPGEIQFHIPLIIPGGANPTIVPGVQQAVTIKLWIRSGAALLQQTKAAKNFLLGYGTLQVSTIQSLVVGQDRPLFVLVDQPLQSAVLVGGSLTLCVTRDLKFPPLCSPGWSLTDPCAGSELQHSLYNLPLDQSYCWKSAQTIQYVATERSIESTVVLPIATAFARMAASACQKSLQHAQFIQSHLQAQQPNTPIGTYYIDCTLQVHSCQLHDTVTAAPTTAIVGAVSAATLWQRPDSILEVELCKPQPLPLVTRFYSKPCQATAVLPSLLQRYGPQLAPRGFLLGTIRIQVDVKIPQQRVVGGGGGGGGLAPSGIVPQNPFDPISTVSISDRTGHDMVSLNGLVELEKFVGVTGNTTCDVPLSDSSGRPMGSLSISIALESRSGEQAAVPFVNAADGLVSLVGLPEIRTSVLPNLDFDAIDANQIPDPATRQNHLQSLTMGTFVTAPYLQEHITTIRDADAAVLAERATAYEQALCSSTVEGQKVAPHQDKSPKPFRPSSSRSVPVLAGIPFNVHTASLSVLAIDAHGGSGTALCSDSFYNTTCGAPADHAREFGNIFQKKDERTGIVNSPIGAVSGGLRRLERKRQELAGLVCDLQTKMVGDIGAFFVAQRQAGHAVTHVPWSHSTVHATKHKLVEAVQALHHVTWTCAVRRASVFSQALGIAVTTFLGSISNASKLQSIWSSVWAQHGYLLSFEGLLSAAGKELGMIEDASVGIAMLRMVQILFVPDDGHSVGSSRVIAPSSPYIKWIELVTSGQNASRQFTLRIGIVPSYHDQRIPAPLRLTTPIRLYPLLFEVGVDIRQWGANASTSVFSQFGEQRNSLFAADKPDADAQVDALAPRDPEGLIDDEDDDVGVRDDDVLVQMNFEGFHLLNTYAFLVKPLSQRVSAPSVHPLLEKLHQHIVGSAGKMDHDILVEASTLVDQLGGGGAVFCKSGKDRTAMHVTFKQAQFAIRFREQQSSGSFVSSQELTLADAALLRTYGTRLPVCEKNVGQAKYAFNSLQVKFMPEALKPPMNTLAGFLKGGKVFTGGIES